MTDDDDFRLNSLHRFEKYSRLALEAHSSCEVPAGCGGSVLQWFDPSSGVPVAVRHASSHLATDFVDGEPLRTSRVRLASGLHLLAIRLAPPRKPTGAPPYLLAELCSYQRPDDPRAVATSRPGTDWRATSVDPGEGWELPAFDDSAWPALAPAPLARASLTGWELTRFDELVGLGAQPLDPGTSATVWVRARFTVDHG